MQGHQTRHLDLRDASRAILLSPRARKDASSEIKYPAVAKKLPCFKTQWDAFHENPQSGPIGKRHQLERILRGRSRLEDTGKKCGGSGKGGPFGQGASGSHITIGHGKDGFQFMFVRRRESLLDEGPARFHGLR